MPVLISFDLANYANNDHNRIQCFFERLGWQSLGGTAYRYPRLGTEQRVEDWFNHVVPALMLLRAYATKYPDRMASFTIDVQTSTGCQPATGYGALPRKASDDGFVEYEPSNQAFGAKNLKDWIDGIPYPY